MDTQRGGPLPGARCQRIQRTSVIGYNRTHSRTENLRSLGAEVADNDHPSFRWKRFGKIFPGDQNKALVMEELLETRALDQIQI